MHRRTIRLVAVLCVSLQLVACMRWEPTPVAPRTLIEQDRPSKVRVIRADGGEVEVQDPIIRSDSIVTTEPCEVVVSPDGAVGCAAPPVAVALSDVRSVEMPRTKVKSTVLLLSATALLLLIVPCALTDCMDTAPTGGSWGGMW